MMLREMVRTGLIWQSLELQGEHFSWEEEGRKRQQDQVRTVVWMEEGVREQEKEKDEA